jgi:putative oxidoreductase
VIRNKAVLCIFRLIVGGVFVWAAVLKIRDPLGFAQNIANYRVVGNMIAFWVAVVLPWLELTAGVLLIVGLWRRTNALLLSLMLAGFIILVAVTIARGIDVDCGCFGSLSRKADLGLILQDAALLFMSLTVWLSNAGKPNPA